MALPKLSPNRACLPCKKRKAKCDGVQPRCGLCTRLDKECAFVNQTQKTKAEVLEERLRRLQDELDTTRKGPFQSSLLSHKIWRIPRSLFPQPSPTMPEETPTRTLLMAMYPDTRTGRGSIDLPQREAYPTEPYSVVIPLDSVLKALQQWNPSTEVPLNLCDMLVRLMLPFRHHLNFHVHVDSFLTNVHRPQSDPKSIHPSLLYAIYLYSCSLGSCREMSLYESVFLNRSRHFIQESLAYADRLLDTIWAQLITAAYYLRIGRVAQAYTEVSGAIRFAVACGLNRLSNIEAPTDQDVQCLLSPTKDLIEYTNRVHLWWALCSADHTLWLSHGLPRTIFDKEVSTTWPPCAISLRERIGLDLRTVQKDSISRDAALRLAFILKVEALDILTRTKQICLAVKRTTSHHDLHSHYQCVADDLDAFHAMLPPPTDCRALRLTEPHQAASPSLLWTYIYLAMADMYLYNVYAMKDLEAYRRTLKAAMEMGALLRMAGGSELVTPLHAMHILLQCASVAIEILAREIRLATEKAGPHEQSPTRHGSTVLTAPSASTPPVMIIQPASSDPHYQAPPPLELGMSSEAREQRIYAAHESLEGLLSSLYEVARLFPDWCAIERLKLVFLEEPTYEII